MPNLSAHPQQHRIVSEPIDHSIASQEDGTRLMLSSINDWHSALRTQLRFSRDPVSQFQALLGATMYLQHYTKHQQFIFVANSLTEADQSIYRETLSSLKEVVIEMRNALTPSQARIRSEYPVRLQYKLDVTISSTNSIDDANSAARRYHEVGVLLREVKIAEQTYRAFVNAQVKGSRTDQAINGSLLGAIKAEILESQQAVISSFAAQLEPVRRSFQSGKLDPNTFEVAISEALCSPEIREKTFDLAVMTLLGMTKEPSYKYSASSQMGWHEAASPAKVVRFLSQAGLSANDVLLDAGSGIGLVVLLAAGLTQARAIGVEFAPELAHFANEKAAELNCKKVQIIQGDVSTVPMGIANRFFIFNSFAGQLLEAWIANLERAAQNGPIEVFSCGTSSFTIRDKAPFLVTTDEMSEREIIRFVRRT